VCRLGTSTCGRITAASPSRTSGRGRSLWPLRGEFEAFWDAGLAPTAGSLGPPRLYYSPSTRVSMQFWEHPAVDAIVTQRGSGRQARCFAADGGRLRGGPGIGCAAEGVWYNDGEQGA